MFWYKKIIRFVLFFVLVAFTTFAFSRMSKVNAAWDDGFTSYVWDEVFDIPRDLFFQNGSFINMIDDYQGYYMVNTPDYDQYGNVKYYVNRIMFFKFDKQLPSTLYEDYNEGGYIYIRPEWKIMLRTYDASDYYYSEYYFEGVSYQDFMDRNNFNDEIIVTEWYYTNNNLALGNVRVELSLLNNNALNSQHPNYDITDDKGNYFTTIVTDSIGSNLVITPGYSLEDLLIDEYFGTISGLIEDPTTTYTDYIVEASSAVLDRLNLGYFAMMIKIVTTEYSYDTYEYVAEDDIPAIIYSTPGNPDVYYNNGIDFLRYYVSPADSDVLSTVSDRGVPMYYTEGFTPGGSFTRVNYNTSKIPGESNVMTVNANIHFSAGYISSNGTFTPTHYFSHNLNLTGDYYTGVLTKGMFEINPLNNQDDTHTYAIVPEFTGDMILESKEIVETHLYNENGIEIALNTSSTGHPYANVLAGEIYYVTISNASSYVYDTLSLRYYRINPMTGYVEFPVTILGHDERVVEYEYFLSTSKSMIVKTTNVTNSDTIVEIYDAYGNLLKRTTSDSFTYYFVGNKRYFIRIISDSLYDDVDAYGYQFRLVTPSSC